MKLAWGLLGFVSLISLDAFAMPAPLQVRPGRISAPLRNGAVIGGQAAVGEFSLIGVNAAKLGVNGQRLTFAYGDKNGKPQKGEPGYFHVQLDRDARRIVIDLAQVHKTTLDQKALARILAPYKLIASSEMTMDPADGSTNITLNLRAPVRMKAGTDVSHDNQAQVVVDLEPTGAPEETP